MRRFIYGTIAASTAVVSVGSGPVTADEVDPPTIEGSPAPIALAPTIEPLVASPGLGYTPITPIRVLDTREALGADLPSLPTPPRPPVDPNVGTHRCLPGETDVVGFGVEIVNGRPGTFPICSDADENAPVPTPFDPGSPPLQGDRSLRLKVTGVTDPNGVVVVPAEGVEAVVMNVTVTQPTMDSFVAVQPTRSGRPDTSNLNFVAGQTIPNLVITKVGFGGTVDVYNRVGNTHVLADIVGYYAKTSDFTGLQTPQRLLDTREGIGVTKGRIGPDASIDLQITGRGEGDSIIPDSGVGSVVMNVTAVAPSQAGFVRVFPSGGSLPKTSSVNFNAGAVVPNLVISEVGAGGKVTLSNRFGTVDLLADVVGYFTANGQFVGLAPDRVLDTRDGTGVRRGVLGPNTSVSLDVDDIDADGFPSSGVTAVAMNVTGTESTAGSFITVWPHGETRPKASSLNLAPGATVANLVMAKVGDDGKIDFFNRAGSTHLVADIVGYVDGTAGANLPSTVKIPSTNRWSQVDVAVTRAELREQDGVTGSSVVERYDTPFILDVRYRLTNVAVDDQRFPDDFLKLVARNAELPIIDKDFFFSLSGKGVEDINVTYAVNWGDDLSDLRVVLGGATLEPGVVNLTKASPAAPPAVPITVNISGTEDDGELCNTTDPVDYQVTSANWARAIDPGVDVSGTNAYQAAKGTRWLEINLDLTTSECQAGNVTNSDFRLDVDSAFVDEATFTNGIIGTLFSAPSISVTLVYEVPLDAKSISFVVGQPGSNEHGIPLAGLQ